MSLSSRWSGPAGYRDVLRIAIPLVFSTSSMTIQQFVDRMFLAWYSPEAMAAAMPAGLLQFALISFFLGTAGYANAFVAQYHGAGRDRRVGPSVWQAIHFSMIAGAALPFFSLLAEPIFRAAGHAAAVQVQEANYFRILMLWAFLPVFNSAASCFYTGLGRNWPVLWVNALATVVNVVLDYGMIFGKWGFRERGIEGAAIATNIANGVAALVYIAMLMAPANAERFNTRGGWRPDGALFKRLLRFGAPAGVQFIVDMMAFTIFLFLVGRIGVAELTATNVSFQINTLAFMPMIGFGIATSTQVGQWLGANRPDLAARATWSAFHITITYMTLIAISYVTLPNVYIDPFAARAGAGHANAAEFAEIRRLAVAILHYVAAYCVLDTMNIIMSSALKGAGDTRFVMSVSVSLGWVIMVLPTWLFTARPGGSITLAWLFLAIYVNLTGIIFMTRFLMGKWRAMRVIEHAPPDLSEAGKAGV